MSSASQWIESNLALIVIIAIILLILNLLVMLNLSSRLGTLSQEVKSLNFGSLSWQQAVDNELDQNDIVKSSKISAPKTVGQKLPDSLLIEKAIALIKADTSASQIKSDLGIDENHLEILLRQHKS